MKKDLGSTMPLLIGLVACALTATLTLSEVLSAQQQALRAKSEARFAALLVAKQTAGIEPVIGFDYSPTVISKFADLASLRIVSVDGLTFEANACVRWVSPLRFRPEEVICSTARARTIKLSDAPLV